MNNEEILLNYLKDENWRYFHEDGIPYKTIFMQDRDILIEYITKLQNNWNELKKWVLEQEQKAWDEVSSTFGYVLNKMQELEQGKDE